MVIIRQEWPERLQQQVPQQRALQQRRKASYQQFQRPMGRGGGILSQFWRDGGGRLLYCSRNADANIAAAGDGSGNARKGILKNGQPLSADGGLDFLGERLDARQQFLLESRERGFHRGGFAFDGSFNAFPKGS